MRVSPRLARTFGQALYENRPHLVEKGCLTPFIGLQEYQQRRKALQRSLPPKSLAIIPGNAIQYASSSVFYSFRQDPNFQYLTGFLEQDACLLMTDQSETIFVPEKNVFEEKWEGERTGSALVPEIFGIADAKPRESLLSQLSGMIQSADQIFVDADPKSLARAGPQMYATLSRLLGPKASQVESLTKLMTPLRLIKSEAEIDCLRQAAEISAAAYNKAYTLPFESEMQLHAFLDFAFRQGGCESEAYKAVVAGGPHALTIHYVRNDDLLRDGELVLVDAGGRYGGYCADISRTWPVAGKFSDPQRDLYEAVLATNKTCIEACIAGEASFGTLHELSVQTLRNELKQIGLVLSPSQMTEVYPHSVGHNLGIDVHDPGANRNQLFEQGQVVTVEPGLYIPDTEDYPAHFRGIGIRVEDDVVISKNGPEVLTVDCLKEIADLEK